MMEERPAADTASQQESFEHHANRPQRGLLTELALFLRQNKKWWLTPIILVLVLIGLLVVYAGSSPLAPFIYPMF